MGRDSRHIRPKEIGCIRKRWRGKVPLALIFPEPYPVGMANLGFQTVYSMLNGHDHLVVERFFLPSSGEEWLRPWRSVESGRPLGDFALLLFSVSFELSYLNIPDFIRMAGLQLFSKDRGRHAPLVVAGGVATQLNPMPVAPLVDAFLLGEFEAMAEEFASIAVELGDPGLSRGRRLDLLKERVPGAFLALPGERVRPARTGHRGRVAHTAVLSDKSAFPNMFMVELSRGCGKGCRFCAAGYIYRPPLPRTMEMLEEALADVPEGATLGLVGLEFLDSEESQLLFSRLLEQGFRLSFSSLRADEVTHLFAELLVRSGQRQATLAPEAGSQRLRDVINKNLSEEEILEAARLLAEGGIQDLKLYFMLGLPTEEDEDAEAIAGLAAKVADTVRPYGRARGRLGRVIVSVSTFVPKPWTPFQWCSQVGKNILQRRRSVLKKLCGAAPNIELRLDSLRDARCQCVLSRGGAELAPAIVASQEKGGFLRALKESGCSMERYLEEKVVGSHMEWDVIEHSVRREYLVAEARRGLERHGVTPPCDIGRCRRCGACSNE